MNALAAWIKNIFLGCGGLFFFFQGIGMLRTAYSLRSPHEFIMSFFASSLIILISAVAILYLLVRLALVLKKWRNGGIGP